MFPVGWPTNSDENITRSIPYTSTALMNSPSFSELWSSGEKIVTPNPNTGCQDIMVRESSISSTLCRLQPSLINIMTTTIQSSFWWLPIFTVSSVSTRDSTVSKKIAVSWYRGQGYVLGGREAGREGEGFKETGLAFIFFHFKEK